MELHSELKPGLEGKYPYNDDFPALWFNLHDPVAMMAAFESLVPAMEALGILPEQHGTQRSPDERTDQPLARG